MDDADCSEERDPGRRSGTRRRRGARDPARTAHPRRVLLGGGLFVGTVGVVAVRFAGPAAIPDRAVVYVAVLLPAVVALALK
jgi:hypothetical protein